MTSVELTKESYLYWLKANKPPLEWFLSLPMDQQAALASIGEEFTRTNWLDLAYCIKDPEAVDAVLSMDEAKQEEILIERMARSVVSAAVQSLAPKNTDEVRKTLSGFGKTKEVLQPKNQKMDTVDIFGVNPEG